MRGKDKKMRGRTKKTKEQGKINIERKRGERRRNKQLKGKDEKKHEREKENSILARQE